MDLNPPRTPFRTPPQKVRKTNATKPTPPRLSDLMAAFGARKTPMSQTRMEMRPNRQRLRPGNQPAFSYAESESDVTPQTSPGSMFDDSIGSSTAPIELSNGDEDSEIEVQPTQQEEDLDSDDVIEVAPRPSRIRELPNRSAKSNINYSTPKKFKKQPQQRKKKVVSKERNAKPLKLTSDLSAAKSSQHAETERTKIHDEIAKTTAPKRNGFILAHKEYFLPLLPEKNHVHKLQQLNEQALPNFVPYKAITSQPEGIVATMKPYQLEGLSFMVYMLENGMSAILGDEMGLGKTLQTLSLFQYIKNKDKNLIKNRPFLVVCPLSVLTSWMNEAKKWVPELHVVRFHGPKTEREKLKEDSRTGKASGIDVLVTTYESFVAEQGWFKRAFVYRYCVLDEGHKIKNSKSNVAHALQSLNAEFRLLLSGTPLQNNLTEMWALLHWLYPEIFDERTADNFKTAFDLAKGNVSTAFMDNARRLLELVMLRRMKNSPGVNLGLPHKEGILLYVPLTPMQRFWYTRLLTKADQSTLDELFKSCKAKEAEALQKDAEENIWTESREIVEKTIQNERVGDQSEWRKLMNLVLQLRKVSCHPYILNGAAPDPYYLGDHVKTASGKFIVLDKLLDELVVKQGKKVLIFAGLTRTLDLCEDLLYLKGFNTIDNAGYRYLRLDGSMSRARRNLGIRMFNDLESAFKVMLISTRAGGLGINLAAASDVIFLDEDWNPQVTLQAEARAHRIGQTQPVTVYKLLSSGTVEEQMMGRIHKKLYLSAKITESMRNIHYSSDSRKRKRGSDERAEDAEEDNDVPQLDTTSLKLLIRRGAQTLARPAVNVTEMLLWDWDSTLEKCKDQATDPDNSDDADDKEEEEWLNSMEKVECAVFEGKKHQKQIEQEANTQVLEYNRADRRAGKNTTVMVDGFAISKDSINCAEWEAVPTLAGKDPRLAERKKTKKATLQHQDFCQHCEDGGSLILCSGCPRSYHLQCLDESFQHKAKGSNFYCPQHECVDCQAKTSDAGGLIYRCRWCENGFCEDCLDFQTVRLIGETLPEYEMLGFGAMENAWYIECPSCVRHWLKNKEDRAKIYKERKRIGEQYEAFLAATSNSTQISSAAESPVTVSEVGTPRDFEMGMSSKLLKMI